jgi:hypothetical protein
VPGSSFGIVVRIVSNRSNAVRAFQFCLKVAPVWSEASWQAAQVLL